MRIPPMESPSTSKVFLISASDSDRSQGVKNILQRSEINDFQGTHISLKANYNSADPFPASTHSDTLQAIVEGLNSLGAEEITLAERSGMGGTRRVLEERGVFDLSEKWGFKVTVLDELPANNWLDISPNGLHWINGFKLAKIFTEPRKVVQTCCLKTHRFGGDVTMSLKNSVGMIAKRDPGGVYDYMMELHSSPYQRIMIAEINRFYKADLIIMDAIKGFLNGGPERGEICEPNLILASKDRIAIDAVGISILRLYGSTPKVMKGRIFDFEQIRRAVELGIGVKTASDIQLVSLDEESTKAANNIQKVLDTQG